MTFTKGERVETPLGRGNVAYQRMKGPTYSEAEAVSVVLDNRRNDYNYTGTMFAAIDVIKNCSDGTCTKCARCYEEYVAAKMAGELD